MEPQAANISTSETPKAEGPERPKGVERDNHWISIAAMAVFVLLSLGVVVFLYSQNQKLKGMIASLGSPAPAVVSTPRPTPAAENSLPTVSSPSANSKISSPLKITGTVPAGWMFEGVFPIKLLDSNKKVIAQVQAKEVVPGSWQSGNPVDFKATMTFKSASGSGTLVLENDNPSGNPQTIKTFEVPVKF